MPNTSKYPSYRKEARRRFGQFPVRVETKQERIARKQAESVPLERAESRALQLSTVCRTADRLLIYDRPANGAAKRVIERFEPDQPPPERSVIVYLIRFSSRVSDEQPFLKIGITNNMGERFGFDYYRYDASTVDTVSGLKRSEALDIERRLHAMFAAKSYSPKLRLLSGGNTECFVDDDEIIKTVATLFELVRAGLAQR